MFSTGYTEVDMLIGILWKKDNKGRKMYERIQNVRVITCLKPQTRC